MVRRMMRGQSGVSLVELLVAMGIFMLFSSLFVAAAIQFIHATNVDAVRARSATQILTATQRIDGITRNASSVSVETTSGSDAGDVVYILIPADASDSSSATATGSAQCVRLGYVRPSGSSTGSIVLTQKSLSSGETFTSASQCSSVVTSDSGSAILTGMTNRDAPFAVLDDGGMTFSPTVGSVVNGKTVESTTVANFSPRNS